MKKFPLYIIPLLIILCGLLSYFGYYYEFFNDIAMAIFVFLGLLTISAFILSIVNIFRDKK